MKIINNIKKNAFYAYVRQEIFNKPLFNSKLSLNEYTTYFSPNWYHDFSCMGLKTYQFDDGGYHEAQLDKHKVLFEFIDKAIAIIQRKSKKNEVSGVELFCADGFYSNYAVNAGCSSMLGIDLADKSGEGVKRGVVIKQARLVTKLLNNDNEIKFINDDVFNLNKKFQLCLCFGGLYHIENPKKLLQLLRDHVTEVLIIQTIVSLETEDENYFESPAPGWTWGCRFSHANLKNMIKETGWRVIDEKRNEMTYNQRLCDKGSSYLMCIPEE